MSTSLEPRSPWRAIIFGALLVSSLGVGALVEFMAGTWLPEPGVGLLRAFTWAGIVVVLWLTGSVLSSRQRAMAAIAPVVLLVAAFMSPWPQPRKQFFRDVSELAVGMSEAAAMARVVAHHRCDASETEYWLRYHIPRVREEAALGPASQYVVLTPSSYNGIIGDSDHCLVVLNAGVVAEVVPCID